MEKVKSRRKSIRFCMLCYIGAALGAGFCLTMLVQMGLDEILMGMMSPRPDAVAFVQGRNISITFQGSGAVPDIEHPAVFRLLKTLRLVSPAVIFGLSMVGAVVLFYKRKLQEPLGMLKSGIDKIGQQELNFKLESQSEDELGELIRAFERMREELVSAFEALWRAEEHKRSLYRAFAHDLRTPLTVIRGSNDNMEQIAVGNRDWSLVLKAAAMSNQAVERIERYAGQLKELESAEDVFPMARETDMVELTEIIRQQSEIMETKGGKKIRVCGKAVGILRLDVDMVLRILDNLLLNALEYSREEIQVTLSAETDQDRKIAGMRVSVCDDGPGFSQEAMKKAMEPFYTTGRERGHTGIGLTISNIWLQKIGGSMSICNEEHGGARVSFFMADQPV